MSLNHSIWKDSKTGFSAQLIGFVDLNHRSTVHSGTWFLRIGINGVLYYYYALVIFSETLLVVATDHNDDAIGVGGFLPYQESFFVLLYHCFGRLLTTAVINNSALGRFWAKIQGTSSWCTSWTTFVRRRENSLEFRSLGMRGGFEAIERAVIFNYTCHADMLRTGLQSYYLFTLRALSRLWRYLFITYEAG